MSMLLSSSGLYFFHKICMHLCVSLPMMPLQSPCHFVMTLNVVRYPFIVLPFYWLGSLPLFIGLLFYVLVVINLTKINIILFMTNVFFSSCRKSSNPLEKMQIALHNDRSIQDHPAVPSNVPLPLHIHHIHPLFRSFHHDCYGVHHHSHQYHHHHHHHHHE